MLIMVHRNTGDDELMNCCVVVLTAPSAVPLMRGMLAELKPLFVVVSQAVTWQGGREQRYRGSRMIVDQEVSRVEIACSEQLVDQVVQAARTAIAMSDGSVTRVGRPRSAPARKPRTDLAPLIVGLARS
jgi:hypothetical protein